MQVLCRACSASLSPPTSPCQPLTHPPPTSTCTYWCTNHTPPPTSHTSSPPLEAVQLAGPERQGKGHGRGVWQVSVPLHPSRGSRSRGRGDLGPAGWPGCLWRGCGRGIWGGCRQVDVAGVRDGSLCKHLLALRLLEQLPQHARPLAGVLCRAHQLHHTVGGCRRVAGGVREPGCGFGVGCACEGVHMWACVCLVERVSCVRLACAERGSSAVHPQGCWPRNH